MSAAYGGSVCQGDLLRLSCGIPVIDADGQPMIEETVDNWLVVGNTCDFQGSGAVEYTQVAPVYALPDGAPAAVLMDLRNYRLSREFFLPPWSSDSPRAGLFADFTKTVAMHRVCAETRATVVTRLAREGWLLLHAALVRFLERDDGRFDT